MDLAAVVDLAELVHRPRLWGHSTITMEVLQMSSWVCAGDNHSISGRRTQAIYTLQDQHIRMAPHQ